MGSAYSCDAAWVRVDAWKYMHRHHGGALAMGECGWGRRQVLIDNQPIAAGSIEYIGGISRRLAQQDQTTMVET